jgi:hypothetical protein
MNPIAEFQERNMTHKIKLEERACPECLGIGKVIYAHEKRTTKIKPCPACTAMTKLLLSEAAIKACSE